MNLRNAAAATLCGLLLPSVGAAYFLHSLAPVGCWLLASGLLVFSEKGNRHGE